MNLPMEPFMAWAEVDLKALRHNYKILKKLAGRAGILPVIKAEAYGHGMLAVAEELARLNVKIFAVSDVVEGMELRRAGFRQEILLLESALPASAADIVTCRLIPTVGHLELAKALSAEAVGRGQKVKVHIKIDSGMGRLGVWYEEAAGLIRAVANFPGLIIDGIMTHFPLADTDSRFTERQIKILKMIVKDLGPLGQRIRYVHAANSMGLSGYRNSAFHLVRPGLLLYGLYPREDQPRKINLKPVLSVKARVIFVKEIARGQGVSYGHTYIAPKGIIAATIAIGYSDGYFRAFSNRAEVLVNGRRCPVIGNVTMDQIIVDVSKAGAVKIGDIAVILGAQKKDMISAEELAKHARTINYEIVCNLGNRLVRDYRQ